MRIGYYCPLVGDNFFESFGVISVDLRSMEYKSKNNAYCQCGVDKCHMSCLMSSLLDKSYDFDGVVLTNCCHEQERLADSMISYSKLPVFKLNIPRNNCKESVLYLSEQLKMLGKWINELHTEKSISTESKKVLMPKEDVSYDENATGVVLSGITLPVWMDKVLKDNGLKAEIMDTCGLLQPIKDDWQKYDEPYLEYAKFVLMNSKCFRSSIYNQGFLSLDSKIKETSPKAAIYFSNEYCTASVYGYPIFKDFCSKHDLKSYKITVSKWDEPTRKVLDQMELVAQMIRGEI